MEKQQLEDEVDVPELAVRSVLLALIESHPDPLAFGRALAKVSEAHLHDLEGKPQQAAFAEVIGLFIRQATGVMERRRG